MLLVFLKSILYVVNVSFLRIVILEKSVVFLNKLNRNRPRKIATRCSILHIYHLFGSNALKAFTKSNKFSFMTAGWCEYYQHF